MGRCFGRDVRGRVLGRVRRWVHGGAGGEGSINHSIKQANKQGKSLFISRLPKPSLAYPGRPSNPPPPPPHIPQRYPSIIKHKSL